MSNRNRLIPMSGYADVAEARRSTREGSLQALEDQLALLTWMAKPEAMNAYQHFMVSYGYRKIEDEVQRNTLGTFLHRTVVNLVKDAPTYFVSHDMVEMVRMASDELPPEGLSPTDVPSEKGFLVFDHPLVLDDHGATPMTGEPEVGIPLHAIAWESGEVRLGKDNKLVPGISYFLFNTAEGLAAMVDRDDEPWTVEDVKTQCGPVPIYDFSGWAYGVPWNATVSDEDVEGTLNDDGKHLVAPIVDITRRVILTTFKMLQQTVVKMETERPYRALKRRAVQYIPDVGDILVVRLRKEMSPKHKYEEQYGTDEEFDGPWYTHRFLVRGHWKRQRFGEGMSESKIIWITPYIKGPEDRPLILKDRIYSLEQ